MLDQVALPNTMVGGVIQQFAHDVELLVPRKDQGLLRKRIRLAPLQQYEMLDDPGEAGRLKHLFPEIGGLVSVRVRRVACALVVALVERQEPR